jgi:hypothetical protein
MSVIDTDVEEIIDEQIHEPHLRQLVRRILRWEEDRVYRTIRHNKMDEFDQMITEYLNDL